MAGRCGPGRRDRRRAGVAHLGSKRMWPWISAALFHEAYKAVFRRYLTLTLLKAPFVRCSSLSLAFANTGLIAHTSRPHRDECHAHRAVGMARQFSPRRAGHNSKRVAES